jgi:aspartate racemase
VKSIETHSASTPWKWAILMILPLLVSLPAYGGYGGATLDEDRHGPPLKTIGIIGIGPQATTDFEERVHRAAQARIEQRANSGYPPMIVYHHRRPPFVLNEGGILPATPLRLDPGLREAAARLGPMVDFLVIVANGPHLLVDEIERAAGRPVLSMVDRSVEEVRSRGWKKVGVLTMGQPTLYTERLDRLGVASETLGEPRQARLNRVILEVMEGREDEGARRIVLEAVAEVRRDGVEGVLLGCTELPILLGTRGDEPDLIHPAQLLAEAAVELAVQ